MSKSDPAMKGFQSMSFTGKWIFTAILLYLAPQILAQPLPEVSIELPPEPPLIGEDYTFTVTFDNTGPDAGYGPYLLLCLPLEGIDSNADGQTCDGASFVSARAVFTNQKLDLSLASTPDDFFSPNEAESVCTGADGDANHPICADPLPIPPSFAGCEVVVVELPFGSFFPDQPPLEIEIAVHVSSFADAGKPLPVWIQGGFRFGAAADGSEGCAAGTPAETDITPSLFEVRKEYLGPEDETATGPSFPRAYEIQIDIADGQTLDQLKITDDLPDNLIFLGTDCPAEKVPPSGIPNGSLVLDFGSVTGTADDVDLACSFDFYVPELDLANDPILGAGSCEALSVDDVRGQAMWQPLDPRDPPDATVTSDVSTRDHELRDLCLAIQKNVVQVAPDIGSPGLTPGDTLEYTLSFQVSDYFQIGQLEVTDVLPDGLDLASPVSFTVFDRFGPCSGLVAGNDLILDDSDRNSCGDGSLTMRMLLSQAMAGCPQLQSAGLLTGGQVALPPQTTGTGQPAVGQITFRARVTDQYHCPGPQDDGAVDKHDELINRVGIRGQVHDPETRQPTGLIAADGSEKKTPIPGNVIEKTIVARNGDPFDPELSQSPPNFAPGDTITFCLDYRLPSTDAEELRIEDFLPAPALDATELTTSSVPLACNGIPPAGTVCLGNDELTAFDNTRPRPCQGNSTYVDSTSNSLCFDYGDVQDPGNQPRFIELCFTLTLTDEPFADGLRFTNQLVETEQNSSGLTIQQTVISQLNLGQPRLEVRKGVVRACCPEPLTPFFVGDLGFGRLSFDDFIDFDPADFELATVCTDTGSLTPAPGVSFDPPGAGCPRFSGTISSTTLDDGALDSNLDGVQPGDRLTFALVVENTGSSINGAYAVQVSDTLPIGAGLEPTGDGLHGIDLCVTSGSDADASDTELAFTSQLNGNQLIINLDDPPDGKGSLGASDPTSGTNVAVITYDLEVTDELAAGLCASNLSRIDSYSGTETGPSHVKELGLVLQDPAELCRRPSITKSIVSTSVPWTGPGADAIEELTIGEIVRYRLEVVLPQGTLDSLTVTDFLPPGLALAPDDAGAVRISFLADQPMDLGDLQGAQNGADPPSFPLQAIQQGQQLIFDLGTAVNNDDDCDEERVIIEFNAQMLNTSDTNDGDIKNNHAQVSLETSGGTVTVTSNSVPARIVEPKLTIDKIARVDPSDPQLAHFEIRITNVGSTIALDVELTDQLPACLTGIAASVEDEYLGQPFGLTGGPGFDNDPQRLELIFLAILPGGTAVVRFDATLCPGADCETRNDALVTWRSLSIFFSPANPTGSSPLGASGDPDGPRDGSQVSGNPGSPNDYHAADGTAIDGLCAACIRGTKFNDLDCDGMRDTDEPPLSGWTINLFSWAPFFPGANDSVMTGTDGTYEFCGLRAGSYWVLETLQPGWDATLPDGGFQLISAGVAEQKDGIDFGNCRTTGCIGGVKFEDLNGNGVRDPGEPGLAGWTIQVTTLDGTPVGQAVTNANGQYEICGLPTNRYQVKEVVQQGWQPTAPALGFQNVGLAPGQTLGGVDFGNRRATACIRGVKFEDLNGNGVRDPGESGLAGWTISYFDLYSNFVTVSGSVQTGDDGSYEICDLPPGPYVLNETVQSGWQPSTPFGDVKVVEVQAGQQLDDIDFGNRQVSSFLVTAAPDVTVDCDRSSGIGTQVTLTIDGGTGPFTCEGEGQLQQREPEDRDCLFRGMPPGTHTYKVTDEGSPDQDMVEIEVTVEDLFEITVTSINPNNFSCDNGQASVSVTDDAPPFAQLPFSFRWEPTEPDQEEPTATGLGPGTFTVNVFDANGCFRVGEVILTCGVTPPFTGERTTAYFRPKFQSITGGDAIGGGSGVGVEVDFSDDLGASLGLEYLVTEQFGLEVGISYTELDTTTTQLEGEFPFSTETRSDELQTIHLGANFHFFPEGRTDVYFGPFVSYLDFPEPPGVEMSDDFSLGIALGFDVPLSDRGWGISGALRYTDTDVDLRLPDLGIEGTVDFNLFSTELGIAFSF